MRLVASVCRRKSHVCFEYVTNRDNRCHSSPSGLNANGPRLALSVVGGVRALPIAFLEFFISSRSDQNRFVAQALL